VKKRAVAVAAGTNAGCNNGRHDRSTDAKYAAGAASGGG
jgi:hypothetical protein